MATRTRRYQLPDETSIYLEGDSIYWHGSALGLPRTGNPSAPRRDLTAVEARALIAAETTAWAGHGQKGGK